MTDFDTYEANGIRVEWTELGEGWDGDYDPSNPEDEELLRFDVYLHVDHYSPSEWDDEPDEDGWWTAQDSSYCTQVPVTATPEQRQELLQIIHAAAGTHDMAMLSWISLDSLTTPT